MDKDKPQVDISDWKLTRTCPFTGQTFNSYILTGCAEGHPIRGTGWIRTSAIVKINFEENKVETMNTIYILKGEPHEEV